MTLLAQLLNASREYTENTGIDEFDKTPILQMRKHTQVSSEYVQGHPSCKWKNMNF